MRVDEMKEQFAIRHARFVAKQAFERAAFIYGQAVADRKRASAGTKEYRDAVGFEDIADSRMSAAASNFMGATAVYLSRCESTDLSSREK